MAWAKRRDKEEQTENELVAEKSSPVGSLAEKSEESPVGKKVPH